MRKPLKLFLMGLLRIDAALHPDDPDRLRGDDWRIVSQVLDVLPDTPAPEGTPAYTAQMDQITEALRGIIDREGRL